jgi:hypothetical protein
MLFVGDGVVLETGENKASYQFGSLFNKYGDFPVNSNGCYRGKYIKINCKKKLWEEYVEDEGKRFFGKVDSHIPEYIASCTKQTTTLHSVTEFFVYVCCSSGEIQEGPIVSQNNVHYKKMIGEYHALAILIP